VRKIAIVLVMVTAFSGYVTGALARGGGFAYETETAAPLSNVERPAVGGPTDDWSGRDRLSRHRLIYPSHRPLHFQAEPFRLPGTVDQSWSAAR
jgi:hypothetical protein